MESRGCPLVVVKTRSKSWSAVIICQITTNVVAGRSCGSVTFLNACHGLAPSTSAASLSSPGTSWRAAR
nr:hypothetical protein [Actinomadura sp. J1-007]